MKQNISRIAFLLNIILFTLLSCCIAQDNSVIIEGQIIGYKGTKPLKYSISPHFGMGHKALITTDSLGRFAIKHSLDSTEFFTMTFWEGNIIHTCRLILEPGKHYSFISEGRDIENWAEQYSPEIYQWINSGDISKSYSIMDKGQMLFNMIDNGTSGHLYHDQWDLSKPDSLISVLESLNQKQLMPFQGLLDNGLIDKSFYDIAKMNLEYTNAYRLAQTVQDSWSTKRYRITDTLKLKKLIKIYPKIFKLFPVEGVDLENHYCFERYVDLYMDYLDDCLFGEFIPGSKKDTVVVSNRLKSKDILSEGAYNTYNFKSIVNYAGNLGRDGHILLKDQLENNQDLIDPNDAFYFNNLVLPVAKSANETYIKFKNMQMPEKMIFLDKFEPINTLEQIYGLVGNKPTLIVLWGSWSALCKSHLRYQESLKVFLDENDISIVYVAKEYVSTKEMWNICIKQYNLEGYHLLLTDSFIKDLGDKGIKLMKYPSYIIVNSLGIIVDSYAPPQGNLKELLNEIKLKLSL